MTEEKANQIIRCVKECWWRVVLVFALPAVAAISILSEWPWRESPWSAAAAIATFFAGGSALWISLREARERQAERVIKARVLRPGARLIAIEVKHRLKVLNDNIKSEGKLVLQAKSCTSLALESIKDTELMAQSLDLSVFYNLEPEGCEKYGECLSYLGMAKGVLERSYLYGVTPGKEEMLFDHLLCSLTEAIAAMDYFSTRMEGRDQ